MMHDSGFTTIICVFWGQFSTWRHPIRLGKLGERDLSLFSHSTFERCFVSTKRHIKALSAPRFATLSAEVDGDAKETDRDFVDPDFSDELPLDGFTSWVRRGNEFQGASE